MATWNRSPDNDSAQSERRFCSYSGEPGSRQLRVGPVAQLAQRVGSRLPFPSCTALLMATTATALLSLASICAAGKEEEGKRFKGLCR